METIRKREDWNKKYLTIQYKDWNTNMSRIRREGFEEGVDTMVSTIITDHGSKFITDNGSNFLIKESVIKVLATGPKQRSYYNEAPR